MNYTGALSEQILRNKATASKKELEEIKSKFTVGKKVKLIANVGDKRERKAKISGIVVDKTKNVVTICRMKQGRKLYNMSFKYTEFLTGDAELIL